MNLVVMMSMDGVAWRGFGCTIFILHFVFVCHFLLLQPLVSASGMFLLSFLLQVLMHASVMSVLLCEIKLFLWLVKLLNFIAS